MTQNAIGDRFTRAYITCALWSSTDESREDGGDPMDQNYGPENLAPETLAAMQADCDVFRERAGAMLDEHADPDMGAHDFWLTRNHHGAGFWDGDWPTNGDALTKLAHEFGEVNLCVGDDGSIYQ